MVHGSRRVRAWRAAKWFTGLAAATPVLLTLSLSATPQLTRAVDTAPASSVTGVVRTLGGAAVPGASVAVELLPSAGYSTTAGTLAHTVASGVTNSAGAFALTVPASDELRAEAAFNGGAINFMLTAMKQPSAPEVLLPRESGLPWPPADSRWSADVHVGDKCRSLLTALPQTQVLNACWALDAASDAAGQCIQDGTSDVPVPISATPGVDCSQLTETVLALARYVIACGGGAAVGLSNQAMSLPEADPTCYAIGASLRTQVDALVQFAVWCADGTNAKCADVRNQIMAALGYAATVAEGCYDQAVPLAPRLFTDGSDELNCAQAAALLHSTVTVVTTTAQECLSGAAASCAEAQRALAEKVATVQNCAAALEPDGATLGDPTHCPLDMHLVPHPTDVRDKALLGAGGIVGRWQEQDNSATGIAIQPVNIGVLTVQSYAAQAGVAGIAEVPPNEPTTSPSGPGGDLADTPNGSADPLSDPMVVPPYVGGEQDVVDVSASSNVTTPPVLHMVTVLQPEDDASGSGGGSSPDDRCKQPKYWEEWIIDTTAKRNEMEPVGEVHASTDEHVDYQYSESARTTIGLAIKPEGKGWAVSGSTSMENSSSTEVDLPSMPGTFARHVMGEFTMVHEHMTWCPYGYDGTDGYQYPTHQDRVRSLHWTGGLDYDSSDQSSFDEKADYKKAEADGRASWLRKGATLKKEKGHTWKYGASASAFGVTLSAESIYDTKHRLTLKAGTSRTYYHIWGDSGPPADASNHAIYAYY